MDEPLADPSAIGLYFVCKLAKKHVKVVLSGEGADELFGGYIIYNDPNHLKKFTKVPKMIRNFIGKTAQSIPFNFKGKDYFIRGSKRVENRFIGNAFIFNEKERKKILLNKNIKDNKVYDVTKPFYDKVKDKDDVTKMQYLDINMWLVGDILLKADKMSMANSLEVRVPYLDKEVFKIASKVPTKYRISNKVTKYAFRSAIKDKLPSKVANRKKLGFPIPIRVWLKKEKYYNMVKESFTSKEAKMFFNTDELLKMLNNHYKGKVDNSRKIWTIYMFLIWYERYFGMETKVRKCESLT